jgi:hypothetical protein
MIEVGADRSDWRNVSRLAQDISRSLKSRASDGTSFEVKVTSGAQDGEGGGGNGGGGRGDAGVAARCTIIIRSPTYDEAFKHAEELTEAGWVCGSSGDNEFTCTGPDEE